MAQTQQPASFTSSLTSGISGFVKGTLAGGTIGAIGGAVVGGVIGLIGGPAGAIAGATTGALVGGSVLAGIGSLAGTVTGVVQSREGNHPSADDVVSVAKVTFAQGVSVGQQMAQEQAAAQSNFAAKIKEQRERAAQQPQRH